MASECQRDVWDFAVELSELTEMGIPRHVLRKLVCQKLIEHRREVTTGTEFTRTFVPENDIVLSQSSCFLLTAAGFEKADQLAIEAEKLKDQNQLNHPTTNMSITEPAAPIWDADAREFRLGEIVVKRFKWPARNQEQVLRAFQQNNWPHKILNPLPNNVVVCRKAQLHDTIKCLNRNQVNTAIKFRGDGTGNGVFWEIVSDYDQKPNGAVENQ